MVVDYEAPVSLARFWSDAAGRLEVESGERRAALRSAHGVGPYLELLQVPDSKAVKNRIHLDVRPYPGEDQLAEVKWLEGTGAVPIDLGQGEVPWAVLADPERNEFCVFTPR